MRTTRSRPSSRCRDRGTVFLSYSRKDKRWLEDLRAMLAPLVHNGVVDVWWDGDIKASQKWREEIDRALASARVGVLLVSSNFLASDFIAQKELPYLIKAAGERKVTLFWVLLTPCLYEKTPLERIQAAHDVSRPLDALEKSRRNAVLKSVCQQIEEAAIAGGSGHRDSAEISDPELEPTRRMTEQELAARPEDGETVVWTPQPGPSHQRLAWRRWLLAAAGFALVVLLAVLWLWPPPGRPATGEAARLYAKGLARLQASDALEARQLFVEAVEAEPEYPLAHLGWAKASQKLGYDREAKEHAKLAFDLSGRLPEEERLQIEAQYWESVGQLGRAIEIYRELARGSPDVLKYGLRVAELQTQDRQGDAALATIKSLRALPSPARDDPRLDLAEAAAEASRSNFDRQRKLAEIAEEKGRRQEARLLVAQALLEQGKAYVSTSKFKEARNVFKQAREIYAMVGDEAALAVTLGEQGDLLSYQGDNAAALRLYREARDILSRLGYRAGEAAQSNRIGSILNEQGKTEQAMAAWEHAVAIFKDIGESTAGPLNNMATLLAAQGKLSEARQRYEEARDVFHDTGDRRSEELVMGNLAAVLHSQGELFRAQEMLEDALRLADAIGDQSGVGWLLYEQARVLATQGHKDQAEQTHWKALKLREELDEKGTVAESRLAMAELLLKKGDPEQARSFAKQALAQFHDEAQTKKEAEAWAVLARALAAQGDLTGAEDAISAAQRLAAQVESAEVHMTVKLAAGHVRAVAGEVEEARRLLNGVRDQAHESGFVGLELEARLELARLEAEHGDRARGRALLAAVEKDARDRGFEHIADEARPQPSALAR